MQTVENQKIIITPADGVAEMWDKEKHKGQEFNRDLAFMMVQKKAMFQAMTKLKPSAFNMWLYLASQKPDYIFIGGFSPAAISKETGLKKSSIQEGIRVLQKENYLIPKRKGSNIFYFYQIPKEPIQEKPSVNQNDFQF